MWDVTHSLGHDLLTRGTCRIFGFNTWDMTRVPGLPVRDYARGCNNRGQTWPKLSAIDVSEKTFFERLYLVSGMGTSSSWALSQLSLCTHNSDCSINNYFSIFVQFFPKWPLNFFVIMIHQIWPSPGTLDGGDPRG